MRNIADQIRLATTISPHFRMKPRNTRNTRKVGTHRWGVRFSTQHPLNPLHEPRFTLSASIGERMAGGQVRCRTLLGLLQLMLPNPEHAPTGAPPTPATAAANPSAPPADADVLARFPFRDTRAHSIDAPQTTSPVHSM